MGIIIFLIIDFEGAVGEVLRVPVLELVEFDLCFRLGRDGLQFAGSEFLHEDGFEGYVGGSADVIDGGKIVLTVFEELLSH